MKTCNNTIFCCKNKFVPRQEGKIHLIFVGEAPGYYETLNKKPLLGKSGELLRFLVRKSALNDAEVNLTNTVKCRPENNRTPKKKLKDECINNKLKEELEEKVTHGKFLLIGVGKTGSYTRKNIRV